MNKSKRYRIPQTKCFHVFCLQHNYCIMPCAIQCLTLTSDFIIISSDNSGFRSVYHCYSRWDSDTYSIINALSLSQLNLFICFLYFKLAKVAELPAPCLF